MSATILHRAHLSRACAEAQCTMAALLMLSRHATVSTVAGVLTVAAEYLEAEQAAYDALHDAGEWVEVPA